MCGDRYLAIETSSPRLSLAIGDDQKVIASYSGARGWRHAESVVVRMQALLRRAMKETMVRGDGLSEKLKSRMGCQGVWISPLQGCYPDARVLLEISRTKLAKAGPTSYRSVLPLYIRRSTAEERR